MKKQIYVLALLVCGLIFQSCNKDDISDKKENIIDENIISFSSSIIENESTKGVEQRDTCVNYEWGSITTNVISSLTTKGSLETTSTIDSVGVFAYYTAGVDFSDNTLTGSVPNFMYNQQVTKTGVVWEYSPQKYWRNVSDKISFLAYAPFKKVNDGITLPLNTVAGIPSLNYYMPLDVVNQPDLMVATSQLNKVKADEQIDFVFKHALSGIRFSLTGNGELVKSIGLKGLIESGTLLMEGSTIAWSNLGTATTTLYNSGIVYDAGQNYVIATSTKIESADLMQPKGNLMVVPQTLTANTKLVITYDDNSTKEVGLDALTPIWEEGKNYVYNITIGNNPVVTDDYTTKSSSNSYIINPSATESKVYKIPIKRVNEYWGNPIYGANSVNVIGVSDAWKVGLLWQDENGLVVPATSAGIKITKNSGIGIDDYFQIEVPQSYNKTGNFVIGIAKGNIVPELTNGGTDGGNQVCLWSWHFWVTDYNPYATRVATLNGHVWTVHGGKLHRYDGGIWEVGEYSNSYIMDRNVGAKRGYFDSVEKKGELLFQYGRKDPFPLDQVLFDIDGNEVNYSLLANAVDGKKTVEYSINNPLQFIKSLPESLPSPSPSLPPLPPLPPIPYVETGNWASDTYTENIDFNWNDPATLLYYQVGKSIFDPSPWGFKMPKKQAWDDVTISMNLMYEPTHMAYDGYAYFYYTGYRFSSIGNISSEGIRGGMCSADQADAELASYMRFYDVGTTSDNSVTSQMKSNGYSVRSVKE